MYDLKRKRPLRLLFESVENLKIDTYKIRVYVIYILCKKSSVVFSKPDTKKVKTSFGKFASPFEQNLTQFNIPLYKANLKLQR